MPAIAAMTRALLPLLLLAPGLLVAAFSCASTADCENNGDCSAGACACRAGWAGASCGALALAPAALPAAQAWPLAAAQLNASAWGFSRVFDAADGRHHALVAVACGSAGVIGSGGGESFIAHVEADQPAGPWALAARHAMFTPQTTFGPHLARGDGLFVAVFRVNLLLNASLCAGASAAPAPAALLADAAIPPSELASGDPEKGTSIWVGYAAAMAGPWQVANVSISGGGGVHKSNPSIAFIGAGGPGGARWAMAYRDNPGKGERLALALAADFRGPYVDVRNISFCSQTPIP